MQVMEVPSATQHPSLPGQYRPQWGTGIDRPNSELGRLEALVESHHLHTKPSRRLTLRLVRKQSQAEFEQMLRCVADSDTERARHAEVFVLAAARLVFDGNGRPELSGFREAGAAASWLVAEAASLGLRAHAIGVWNVTLARQATRLTGDYEPLTVVAISRRPTASGENGEKPRLRGGLSGFKLRRVTDYLEAHLSEQIRLTDMAAVVGMSPYHLCRIFKQSMGLAPHQWVLRQRIRSAQTLMGDRGLSLTDISYRVGFSSQAHFTTVFRKIAGMTPRQWREEHIDEPLASPDTTFESFAAVRC